MPLNDYLRTTWQNAVTAIDEIRLNNIEAGLDVVTDAVRHGQHRTFPVREYGAVLNGTTDDSTAINAAITAANAAGGGVVTIPAGVALVAQKIVPLGNVTLTGMGMGVTTIKAQDSYAPTPGPVNGYQVIYNPNPISNFTLANLTVDGNEPTGTTNATYYPNSHCVDIRDATGLVVEQVEIVRAIRFSLHVMNSTDVLVTGCRITTGQGTALGASREQQDGIHLTSPRGFRVGNNHIVTAGPNDVGDDGIVVRSPSTATYASANGTIVGNVISSDQSGIKLVGDSTHDVTNVTITGNTVYDTFGGFITCDGYTNMTGKFRNVTIVGNTGRNFVGASTHVIRVGTIGTTECFENVVIADNSIDGVANRSAFAVVAEWGKKLTVTGNVARNVAVDRACVIGGTGKPVSEFAVSGNVFDVTASTIDNHMGIYVTRGRRGTVSNNVIQGKLASGTNDTNPGIQLTGDVTDQTTDVAVVGNCVLDCTAAIKETGTTDWNKFVGNVTRTCTTGVTTVGVNSTVTA